MANDRAKGATAVTSLTTMASRLNVPDRTPESDWFGPGHSFPAMAPPGVAGRQFDYPVGTNLNLTPRREASETPITFEMLRRVAEPAAGGLDLLRLAIETRKDQMAAQKWKIRGRDESDGGAQARAIELALRRPDGVTPFLQWQRQLLEDQLVIDGMSVYYRPKSASEFLIEAMDAATLKRVLDASGRVPLPPNPAYQQVLKGIPAVNYTLEELTYCIRNPRTNRVYGFSPVEQVIGIVNLALRRQLHITQYYTEGNVPELLIGVPEAWSPQQIEQFQTWWDALIEGDTAQRRHAKFVPGGMQPHPTKDPELKGELDDWLSRVVCYAFSLPSQALVKAVNRATAETDKEAAQEQGLEPFKLTWKDFMDEIIERGFKAPQLEFVYADEEITDPKVKAEVISILVGKKPVITADEGRDMLGLDPATPEQKEELAPPVPDPMGEEGDGEAATKPSPTDSKAKFAADVIAEMVKKKPARRSTVIARRPGEPSGS